MTKYWTCGGTLSTGACLARKDCTGIAAFAISASTTRRVVVRQKDRGKNQTAAVAAVGSGETTAAHRAQQIHSLTMLMQLKCQYTAAFLVPLAVIQTRGLPSASRAASVISDPRQARHASLVPLGQRVLWKVRLNAKSVRRAPTRCTGPTAR